MSLGMITYYNDNVTYSISHTQKYYSTTDGQVKHSKTIGLVYLTLMTYMPKTGSRN